MEEGIEKLRVRSWLLFKLRCFRSFVTSLEKVNVCQRFMYIHRLGKLVKELYDKSNVRIVLHNTCGTIEVRLLCDKSSSSNCKSNWPSEVM